MEKADLAAIEEALFEMGLFISGVVDQWTYDQRLKYEQAMRIIDAYKRGSEASPS